MKKFLTLAFALVFTTGIAFGQTSDATIQQVASNSDADITQSNNSNNKDLTATINQSGSGHDADINQTLTGGGPSATASVTQTGSQAFADVDQNLDNSGKTVSATVSQDGLNDAFVTQGSNMSNSRVELTQVYTGAMARGAGDDRNIADINQESGGSRVIASQTGVGNEMNVDQLPLIRNRANLTQAGDENLIVLEQSNSSFGSNSEAVMNQDGSDNAARLDQSNTVNDANVLQDGDANTLQGATLDGNGDAVGVAGSFAIQGGYATLDLDQIGSDNTASVYQVGGASGALNTATIMQNGGGLNAAVYQDGAGNSANVMQSN